MPSIVKLVRFIRSSAECAGQPGLEQCKICLCILLWESVLHKASAWDQNEPSSLLVHCSKFSWLVWTLETGQDRSFPWECCMEHHVSRSPLENIPKTMRGCCCSVAPCTCPQLLPGSPFSPAAPFPLALCRLSKEFTATSSTLGWSEVQVYMWKYRVNVKHSFR